ncbi:MAG: alanine racemase, partial [Deltaproteobacteria bacterium]|nr:alanine racemase [Deltaproteobacteria bacterium]
LGTPVFVYSEGRFSENAAALVEALAPPPPRRLRVAYSTKTASEPGLLRALAAEGLGAEVACEHELEQALRAGFAPQDVIVDGPAHTAELVGRALSAGVRCIKVDSPDQLRLVERVAGDRPAPVCLRLRAPRSRWLSGPADGLSSRFGFAPGDLSTALAAISDSPRLELVGLAVHGGSQITGPEAYDPLLGLLADAARRSVAAGHRPAEINIGGGFPSPSLGSTSPLGMLRGLLAGGTTPVPPIERFGRVVRAGLAGREIPGCVEHLVVEPGRALVSDAAVLLTRVVAAKGRWLILDASRNFVPESLLFARRRFLAARRGGRPRLTNLAGCTLSGGDVLEMGARLPRLAAGDLLVMLDAGAYTLSRANRFTTTMPPAYAMADGGELRELRRRETAEDVADAADV